MLSGLLGVKKIDDTTRESLQHILLTSDIGVETTDYILQETEKKLRVADESVTVEQALREVLVDLLEPSAAPWALPDDKPTVILFVGVNGSGKTTTIGRLGHALKASGKSVLLAAGILFVLPQLINCKAGVERLIVRWLPINKARTVPLCF